MKLLLLLTLASTTSAFAWGPTGHRVVGEIAERMLEPRVAIKTRKILKGQSLARVSTWPDEIKSEPQTYSHTYRWHYTDWPDHMEQHDETHSGGSLLASINEQLATLKSDVSEEQKAFALKFLVHLVGDLHQPLHVGNGRDQGGNLCRLSFHGKNSNLHELWDEGMIDFTRLSFTELAAFVGQGRTVSEIKTWESGSVLDWARESKELRNTIYPQNMQACSKDAKNGPKLGYEYSYKFVPVVERRLYQAGLRLARLLNESL